MGLDAIALYTALARLCRVTAATVRAVCRRCSWRVALRRPILAEDGRLVAITVVRLTEWDA